MCCIFDIFAISLEGLKICFKLFRKSFSYSSTKNSEYNFFNSSTFLSMSKLNPIFDCKGNKRNLPNIFYRHSFHEVQVFDDDNRSLLDQTHPHRTLRGRTLLYHNRPHRNLKNGNKVFKPCFFYTKRILRPIHLRRIFFKTNPIKINFF